MSIAEPCVTFRELFSYNDYLATRWMNYFQQHPEALEIDIGGKTGTVHQLVKHIFQAQQLFVDRLGLQQPGNTQYETGTLEELRLLHQESHAKLVQYAATVTEEELRQVRPFGPVMASKRKILTQAALHGVHHWAQVAMEVRQAGFPTGAPQDLILTDVME